MSRCFPFPPPGYEKKLKVEDVTLLAKEKGKEKKEKKHKKEKSKERKEGREKDKEKSKEKRKEKDKTKDRDKKNDKKQSQNEKRSEADKPTVEKMGSNSPQSPSGREHEQRISFVDGATGSKTVIGVYDKDQGKTEVLELDNRTNGAANVKMGSYQSKSQKVESNFSYEKNQNSNRKADKSKNPLKETAVVQDLHRRIRDENGATSSQGNSKTDVTIQKRAQISGGVSNGNVICFPQTKENSRSRNDSYRLENGQKDDIQSKVSRLAIVHNFKAEERVNEMPGVVDLSKKSGMEGLERNRLCGKGGVDNRKNDQFMDVDRKKSKKEERLKEDDDNVKHRRSAENGGDSTDNSRHYIFKMGNKTAEVTTGKRKEPEANGILHNNETRPEKIQRTVLSSEPATATENGRNSRMGTSITLSTSKQTQINGVGNGHKSNRTMGAQSPQVSTKSPSVQGSPFGLKRPPLFVGKVHGTTGPLEPPSMSAIAGKGNGSVAAQESPLDPTNPPTSIRKLQGTVGPLGSPPTPIKADIQETADIRESAKPALIAGKVNGVVGADGSPLVTLKSQFHSGKEKRRDKSKSSSKPRRPHPDTEYLSQILSVPKIEELPELDDLEWLSGSKKCPLIEGEVAYSEGEGEHVWSKAVHIESADIYALPYVIPY